MNIYIREIRAHIKSFAIWSVSMIFLIVVGMSKYSAGSGISEGSFNEMLSHLPKFLQNLFGVGVFDLSKAIDYYAVFFLYIALVGAIYAVILGSGIIAKEERDKTCEFLLVKPISRYKIILFKLLAALSMLIVFNVITYFSSISMLTYYSSNEPFSNELLLLSAALLCIQLLFAVLGAFIASLINKPKISSSVSTGILMLTFLISIFVDIVDKLDFLKYFTPFKYFDSKDILKGSYNALFPIITMVLFAAFVWGTFYFYKRRDMRV